MFHTYRRSFASDLWVSLTRNHSVILSHNVNSHKLFMDWTFNRKAPCAPYIEKPGISYKPMMDVYMYTVFVRFFVILTRLNGNCQRNFSKTIKNHSNKTLFLRIFYFKSLVRLVEWVTKQIGPCIYWRHRCNYSTLFVNALGWTKRWFDEPYTIPVRRKIFNSRTIKGR